jgi:predicted dehydrogenase
MMGRHHARVLSSLDGVELVGIADPAGGLPGQSQGVPVVESLSQLIAMDPDYVVVASPTRFHEEMSLRLADAGIHALVEKPLSTDSASATKIAEAFQARGLVGAVGHVERYNPALQEARRRISSGAIGSILQIATRRQGPFPGRIDDVGVILDLATHDLDLTSWVAQRPFARISATTAHRSGRPHEDLVAITGQLDDGTVTNHLVNWLSPMKERVTVITGERGTLVADTLAGDLFLFQNASVPDAGRLAGFFGVTEGDMTRFAFAKPEPLRIEHESFRDAVLGLGNQIVSMRSAAATVAVAEAARHSAETGETVAISPIRAPG